MTEQTKTMTVEQAVSQLTPAGKAFMTLVGQKRFDFFDDGIVEGSGNWGYGMADQATYQMDKSARSMGGIMARLASDELGLWEIFEDEGDGSVDTWWSLTALGADVANALAEQEG